MSELGNKVQLEAKKGKIIISKPANPREKWGDQIDALLAKGHDSIKGFGEMDALADDGLENAPWDGPTFEEWQNNNAKLS